MKKGLRVSDKWFQRGLWLIAICFASFLIGLGSKIVGDLPKIEHILTVTQFIDVNAMNVIKREQNLLLTQQETIQTELKHLNNLEYQHSETAKTAEENFNAWIATRSASQANEQNPELIKRTQHLENLRQTLLNTKHAIHNQTALNESLQNQSKRLDDQTKQIQQTAELALTAAINAQDLRIFLYRLALTLPLLIIGTWLFIKYRQSPYWPFVWGFILFALFTFFVELVPYMPSYGGYVRYSVGIIMTVLIGHYAIKAIKHYQTKQIAIEQMPEHDRREEINYEQAFQRMDKNICPSCERPININHESENFCGHCGIGLFRICQQCNHRNNAFIRFCKLCGINNLVSVPNPNVLPIHDKVPEGSSGITDADGNKNRSMIGL